MKSAPLTVYPRTATRRSGVRQVRQANKVPAVIYGRHRPPENLEITSKDLENLIHHSASENILVDLSIPGAPNRLALVQEIQHHALSGKVLHVDFHEVVETEKVQVTIPVETVGVAVGVKTGGGVLEHVLFKLKLRGLPRDLPEVLSVDVSNLDIGKSIHIGDIPAPPGCEILGEKKIVVISVASPLTEEQETAATEAAVGPAEPEMIKEKKEDGTEKAPEKGSADKGEKAGGEKKPEKKK